MEKAKSEENAMSLTYIGYFVLSALIYGCDKNEEKIRNVAQHLERE